MSNTKLGKKIEAGLSIQGMPNDLILIVIAYDLICSFLQTITLPLQPPLQQLVIDTTHPEWSMFSISLPNQEILEFAVRFTRHKDKLCLVLLANNTTKTRIIPCDGNTDEKRLDALNKVILRRVCHAQVDAKSPLIEQHVNIPHVKVDDTGDGSCCEPYRVGDVSIYDGDCARLGCTLECPICEKVYPYHNFQAIIRDYDTGCYDGCMSTLYILHCISCCATIEMLCAAYDENKLEELNGGRTVVMLPNVEDDTW